MSVFRPANLNKRLAGTQNSPGNGGQIGPIKTAKGDANTLGCRTFDAFNRGVFRLSESFCGVKDGCNGPQIDCKGFLFCLTTSRRWFVAPYCTQVARNWYSQGDAVTLANSLMGSCGWFFTNPGFAWSCRQYWDAYDNARYWNQGQESVDRAQSFDFASGAQQGGHNNNKWNGYLQRAFRCVDY